MNRDTAPTHVKRSFSAEIRAEKRDKGLPVLLGHAAVFNSLSEDLGGYRERIAPGAFDGLLEDPGIYCLWNHNPDFIIAATADGSLRLSQDETGLVSECDPMDTQMIRDLVVTPISQGKVRKMSFAFDIAQNGQDWTVEEGTDIRTITRVGRLYDTSPVTYPAYPGTDISSRSLAAILRGVPREQVMRLLRGTQEECESEGGTWDSEQGVCVMPETNKLVIPSGGIQGDAVDGRSLDTAEAVAEMYARRLRMRRINPLERTYRHERS